MQSLSSKLNTAIDTLVANGYNGSYETNSLSVSPRYNFLNGRSEIIGQQASQSLTVTVRGLDAQGTKVGTLVDALADIDGLNINSVVFDIEDKTQLQTQARAAAFEDAKSKATDYATFAGLSLGRTLTVDDGARVEGAPIEVRLEAMSFAASGSATSTSVPVG